MSLRRAALLYTLARLLLFTLFALLIWSVSTLLGHSVNGFPLLLLALLLSSGAGLLLLAGPRARFAQALAQHRETTAP